jgi:hypothetical protein
MTLTCKDVTRLVSEGLDRDLAVGERTRLLAHYAICKGCRNLRERMQFLRRAMQAVVSREDSGKS